MAYRIEIKRSAVKALRGIQAGDPAGAKAIRVAIDDLALRPRPPEGKKLTDEENTWRIRVRGYRVLYEIYDRKVLVFVVRIQTRGGAYKK